MYLGTSTIGQKFEVPRGEFIKLDSPPHGSDITTDTPRFGGTVTP